MLASGPDDEGVAVLTLNRPEKKNALSIALREEAIAILGRLAGDEAVKALVVTGSGGCFSAGFDLREFAVTDPGHRERLWLSSDQFHHAVHRFPVPMIAAVDGIAYGGGFDLAVLCDLRIATRRAAFAHPEAAQGPVVYGPLHDLVGGAIARELVLTGREVDALKRCGCTSSASSPALASSWNGHWAWPGRSPGRPAKSWHGTRRSSPPVPQSPRRP